MASWLVNCHQRGGMCHHSLFSCYQQHLVVGITSQGLETHFLQMYVQNQAWGWWWSQMLQGKTCGKRFHPNIWSGLQQNLCTCGIVCVNSLYPCTSGHWRIKWMSKMHLSMVTLKKISTWNNPKDSHKEVNILCVSFTSFYMTWNNLQGLNAFLRNIEFVKSDVNFNV